MAKQDEPNPQPREWRGAKCCVLGCRKRRKPRGRKTELRSDSEGSSDEESAAKRKLPRSFHSLPLNPERRSLWLVNMNCEDWQPGKNGRLVCSDHFKEKDMDRTGQNIRLRENAIPTRFKGLKPKPKKKVSKRSKFPDSTKKVKKSPLNGSEAKNQRPVIKPGVSKSKTRSKILSKHEICDSESDGSGDFSNHDDDYYDREDLSNIELSDSEHMPFLVESNATITDEAENIKAIDNVENNDNGARYIHLDHGYALMDEPPALSDALLSDPIPNNENTDLQRKEVPDHQYVLPLSARSLKRKLDRREQQFQCLRRKLKTSQQKSRRLQANVKKLKETVKDLRERNKQLASPLPVYVLPPSMIFPISQSSFTSNTANIESS